jgi:hypothetical protein
MSITVTLMIGGQALQALVDDDALQVIADALAERQGPAEPESPFMTISEAALYIGSGYIDCDGHRKKPCGGENCRRCHGTGQVVNRRRIDHLLSAGLIPRVKDGGRTLIRTADLDAYLDNNGNGRRTR